MVESGLVFPALYTRSTAKKKKGWLDGSIIVAEGFAILKDESGNEISKVKLGSHEAILVCNGACHLVRVGCFACSKAVQLQMTLVTI